MPWTDPPKLTKEEELQHALSAMLPRDAAMMIALMTFCSLVYDAGPKPEKDHFKDMAYALLRGCKHTTEMDLCKFLDEQLVEAPEGTSVKDIRDVLQRMGLMSGQKADQCLAEAQKLLALLPNAEKPDAR